MNQLKVISFDGQLVTDSREVAEMIGKEHKELLRSIRHYNGVLTSANLRSLEFFIPHYYTDAKKEQRPCFLLTKKGCDMVANKTTGKNGILFTAEYVSRFNEMEEQLKNKPRILNEKEQMIASMKLTIETAEEVNELRNDVDYLKNNMRIDGAQEHALNQKGKNKVIKSLQGYRSPAYQKMANKVFARFWRDFKQHFLIPRYSELPKRQFDDALIFIEAWQPDTSTRLEIQSINRQQTMKDVG